MNVNHTPMIVDTVHLHDGLFLSRNPFPEGESVDFRKLLTDLGWRPGNSALKPIEVHAHDSGKWGVVVSRAPTPSELTLFERWPMHRADLWPGGDTEETMRSLGPGCVVYNIDGDFLCPFCDKPVKKLKFHGPHIVGNRSRAKKAE